MCHSGENHQWRLIHKCSKDSDGVKKKKRKKLKWLKMTGLYKMSQGLSVKISEHKSTVKMAVLSMPQ